MRGKVGEIPTESPPMGHPMQVGYVKIDDYRQKTQDIKVE